MTTLLYFTHDLRLHDNGALAKASAINAPLICLYCVDPLSFTPKQFGLKPMSQQRWQFLHETLFALDEQLQTLGQCLTIIYGCPDKTLSTLIEQYHIKTVISSRQFGYNEHQCLQKVQHDYPYVDWNIIDHSTLFSLNQLHLEQLPTTFSQFRRQYESLTMTNEYAIPSVLPPPITVNLTQAPPLPNTKPLAFKGGEPFALIHSKEYFSQHLASTYKKTRNAIDEWSASCKFSPWLALGAISPKRILKQLQQYEQQWGANGSTHWIYIELLWREYFQWYAYYHGKQLFLFCGIHHKKPLTSFYPQRFKQWVNGDTPWPLVNAAMKQLQETGYISNRARQIVASCLVNELQLDWRCGAAYFEQQLLDYDVAVNWGNWQYIAGVGADPRGGRHFNLAKQTELYDPKGEYQQRWLKHNNTITSMLDSVDAADWPIV